MLNEIKAISNKNEIWKQSSLASAYYVSNQGRLYSTLHHKLIQPEISDGYARVFIKDPALNHFKHYYVHILVATEFCKGKSEGAEVHHKDTNKLNNRASNLLWLSKPVHNYVHHLIDIIRRLGGDVA